MIKKTAVILICISSLFLLFGCGNNDLDPGNEEEITIELVNKTENITVSYALFYGTGLDEWGDDLLGEEVIEPGETVAFVLPEGEYTVIPMTFEYYVLPVARNISENFRMEIGAEDKVPILVTNDIEVDIGFLYISPTESEDWGEDWLSGEVIAAGISKFFFTEPGTYDLLAMDLEGERVLEKYEIEVDGERHFIIEDLIEEDEADNEEDNEENDEE